MTTWDAIVVGGRCAGAVTAMLLARKGHKVLLLEKRPIGSDTISTLYIQCGGVARLGKWGVLDAIRAQRTPALPTVRWDFGPVVLEGTPENPYGVTECYAPKRTVLDKILVEAAASAGVEVRERTSFEDVLRDGDAVVGIRAATESGAVTERARIVIGADGMRSPLAAAVGAEAYAEKATSTCTYYACFDGFDRRRLDVIAREAVGVAIVPTNDTTLVVVTQRVDRFGEMKSDVEAGFFRALEAMPEIAAEARAAKRTSKFFGSGDLPMFLRRAHGPGWTLVGDAGLMKDPVLAQGIGDALRFAELLSERVHEGLSTGDMKSSLDAYAAERDAYAIPMIEWAHRVAQLKPLSPKMQFLLTAVSKNQSDIERFLGVNAGTVSPEEFFAPSSIEQMIARAVP